MTEQIIPIDADELEAEIAPRPAPVAPQRPDGKSIIEEAYGMLIPNALRTLSKSAIVSFVLGLLTFWTFGFTAIPAIIFGHVALHATREQKGRWMAVVGLVLGYGSFAVFGLVIFGGLLYAVLN